MVLFDRRTMSAIVHVWPGRLVLPADKETTYPQADTTVVAAIPPPPRTHDLR